MHAKSHEGLRTWATVLKIVAWIVLALGVISAIAAIVGGHEAAQRAAQRGLEMTGTGMAGAGITGGVAAFVMSVVWFLILYVLAEVGQAVADIWAGRLAAGEAIAARTGISTEPGYTPTRPATPPAGAPT
ncbi:MAG: hypothetical protein ACM3VW_01655 [Bacteroidota bacterium]